MLPVRRLVFSALSAALVVGCASGTNGTNATPSREAPPALSDVEEVAAAAESVTLPNRNEQMIAGD